MSLTELVIAPLLVVSISATGLLARKQWATNRTVSDLQEKVQRLAAEKGELEKKVADLQAENLELKRQLAERDKHPFLPVASVRRGRERSLNAV